jgi:hypothetical protein
MLSALRVYVIVTYAVCQAVLWRFRASSAVIFGEVDEAARDLGLLSGVVGRLEVERFKAHDCRRWRAELDIDGLLSHRAASRGSDH